MHQKELELEMAKLESEKEVAEAKERVETAELDNNSKPLPRQYSILL